MEVCKLVNVELRAVIKGYWYWYWYWLLMFIRQCTASREESYSFNECTFPSRLEFKAL